MVKDFDAVLLKVGEFGFYQKLVVWLLTVPACFLNAYGGFGLVFQAYTPSFACRPYESEFSLNERNESIEYDDSCTYRNSTTNSTEKCPDAFIVYDKTYFDRTIITQYGLVCDKAIYYKNALSFFNLFSIIGCVGFSIVQDQWGRKRAFFLCLTMYMVSSVASLFAPNLLTFAVLRIPWAMGMLASWNVAYIWALEYVGPSKRTTVTFVLSVWYGVAAVSVGAIAWPCRTWVQLVLATTVPFILLYGYWFVLDESPRWLVSQGRLVEAQKIVARIAKGQKGAGRQTVTDREEINRLLKDVDDTSADTATVVVVAFDVHMNSWKRILCLFKTPNLRHKTLLITWTWFSVAVTYCGVAYNMENLGGNFYVNYVVQAAVEIPANFVFLLVFDRFGRVLTLAFAQLICCSLFAFLAVPAQYIGNWAVVACSVVVKFGSCLGFAIVYQLAGELYPTVLRGSGTGFSSALGDLGNVLMPYLIHTASAFPTLPLLILGVVSLATGVASLFLPETAGQLLPETVEEAADRGEVGWKSFKTTLSRIKSRKFSLL